MSDVENDNAMDAAPAPTTDQEQPFDEGDMNNNAVEIVQIPELNTTNKNSYAYNREPILASMKDHFTLPTKSNMVRFRTRQNAARVYENKASQMIIEETYDAETDRRQLVVKSIEDTTKGLQFLRATYSIVCALFTGFFFVFCLQVLLFLVLDLAVVSGSTAIDASVNVGSTIGVVLAIIVFVHGFASALVIAGHYIADTWSGHYLTKQFVFSNTFGAVTVDWIFFFFFLFMPLCVMCGTLLSGSDDWWTITSLVWFSCVLAFFVIFTANIVYYEVNAAYDFAKNRSDTDSDSFISVVSRCIRLRQVHTYSGKKRETYLAKSSFRTTEDTEDKDSANIYESTREESMGLWSKLTHLNLISTGSPGIHLFHPLEQPTRLYTIDDVQDFRPFLTRSTWSLERIFCRPSNSRYIAIVNGPGSLTRAQIRSSLVCSLLGTVMILLVLVSFLVWMGIPGGFVAVVFVMAAIMAYNSLDNARKLVKVSANLIHLREEFKNNPDDNQMSSADEEEIDPNAADVANENADREMQQAGEKPSEGVFLVSQYTRTTRATDKFCWIMMFLEVGVFFVYPAVTLFVIGNWNIGVLFLVVSSISAVRYYINAVVIIEETGNMELVDGDDEITRWNNKARLSDIVGSITTAKSRKVWTSILGFVGFAFIAIFLSAIGSSTEGTFNDKFTYLNDFYYPPQTDEMRYPTCTLSNFKGGFGEESTLADFAYLAGMAYRPESATQNALDGWFGNTTTAIDNQAKVDEFRAREDKDNSAVTFKLVEFPDKDLSMIVIRGTQNNWDMLADSQLWSAAALMQMLREFLPFGPIWSPILDELVVIINTLQSETVEKISFYKLTTKFAKELKNDPDVKHVQVTGHSLGGGLSIITGAQAGIPAVGLSGPNARISGRSFDPKVTADDLNKYTFNIIPNRDVVPMLDDVADQFQYIRCNAELNDPVGCHDSTRSLCEIMWTCGTGNRPALCECHTQYGFDKPVPTADGTRTFEEACPTDEA
mmetsp:Transcript_16499/g.46088  ORF Transcript_16499/g.46088 Transcript_16499/m.46088 type:complete len:996 (+) Transcript_16499:244-3231(+)